MVSRLTLTFEDDLKNALQEMSESDFRPPKEQIRYLVAAEAMRRGILPAKNSKIASVKVATQYAHRNGEATPPTDDDYFIGTGMYWFNGIITSPDCGTYDFAGIVECTLTQAYNDCTGETLPKSDYNGQWWGPIVPPWETEPNP